MLTLGISTIISMLVTNIYNMADTYFVSELGSTETIFPYAKDYVIYILIATPLTITSFALNNILRYEGKAFFAMIGLTIGGILNIICDPILIFGFDMGVAGAGLSTAFIIQVSNLEQCPY